MLRVEHLTKRYASGRGDVVAIDDICCAVPSGAGIVLAGRSGSGKTTLLNCIGALERPDTGSVYFNDMALHALSVRQQSLFRREFVGFVFQSGNLLPWLSVRENLMMPLAINGVRPQEGFRRISELLELFGLRGYENAFPTELSGGESQRVAFARAVAHKPSLLLADEPTASLDSVNSAVLIQEIISLCQLEGTTFVLATHDNDLIDMASQVLWLKDGRVHTHR